MSRAIKNPGVPEVKLPDIAIAHVDVTGVRPRSSVCPTDTFGPTSDGDRAAEAQPVPTGGDDFRAEPFLFDDPYWDEAFDSYHNRTLRTCCRS